MSIAADNKTAGDNRKILEIESLSAGYNGHIVLRNINLSIHRHDFMGLIGPNGSGKTTLLKVLLGIISPFTGTVHYHFGQSSTNGKNIGYLPQLNLFDRQFPISVLDVVRSGLILDTGIWKQISGSQLSRAREVLKLMGISGLEHLPIGKLSGGQTQRVFLARALVSSPKLLILDEPNTFVDQNFEKSLYDILKELNKSMAIVMVSHDLGMIASHVKSIACLSDALYYHDSSEITQDLLDKYNCPIDLITHGDIPHRVLRHHHQSHD
jgi:zinc transport system ATP-binding protein